MHRIRAIIIEVFTKNMKKTKNKHEVIGFSISGAAKDKTTVTSQLPGRRLLLSTISSCNALTFNHYFLYKFLASLIPTTQILINLASMPNTIL